jgi:hypothetical protein
MVKKKVTKKTSKKVTKKTTRKVSKKTNKKQNKKISLKKYLELKTLMANELLFWSIIVFAVSWILYGIIQVEQIYTFFGTIAILAGSVALLSIILEVIFFLLRRGREFKSHLWLIQKTS